MIEIDGRISKIDRHISEIDGHVVKLDNHVAKLDDRMNELENSLLDEIGRTQTYLEGKIGKVEKNLEELNQYYKIAKLENDNTTLLLKMIDALSKRVEDLEKKTA